jgi:hypothetical protein
MQHSKSESHGRCHRAIWGRIRRQSYLDSIAASSIVVLALSTSWGVLAGATLPPQLPSDDSKTALFLKDVRAALGGVRLDEVSSILLAGDAERPGAAIPQSQFEIRVALPDRYICVDHFRGIEPAVGVGLDRNTLVDRGAPAQSLAPKDITAAILEYRLKKVRREAARVAVALLMTERTAIPIHFRYAGLAQSPDGLADALAFDLPDQLPVRLLFDRRTHLPLMMSYEDLEFPSRTPTTAPPGQRYGLPAWEKVTCALYLSDYKRVAGVLLPHSIVEVVAGRTVVQRRVVHASVNDPRILDAFGR